MTDRKLLVTLDGIVFGLQTHGGISNYWSRLIRHMDGANSIDGHVVIPKRLRYAEYDVNWQSNSTWHKELVPTAISRYLDVNDDRDCDVLHSSYFRKPSRPSVRYVVTVYDFIYERYGQGLTRLVHSWQKRRSIAVADEVICISNATRNDVLRYVPEVDPSRVHVVYLGVDQSTFYPDSAGNSHELKDVVLFVGQRSGYKRFDLAVKALAQCRDLSLGLVGPAPTEQEIRMLNNEIFGRWYSFGVISSSRLRELYSSAFAFIYPSDYEGFGLPILEAMACGCPAVVANTGSLPEVGGSAALYACEQDPAIFAAALAQLRNSESHRQAVINAGLKQSKKFTWERTFSETISIYRGQPSTPLAR